MATTTSAAADQSVAAVTVPIPGSISGAAPSMRVLANRGARLLSWKTGLMQSLGRELNALYFQQQERAFMATTHGLNYRTAGSRLAALH